MARRQKETGSYYYLKLDGYDMATLCSSTESRIGERRLLLELDLGQRILYGDIMVSSRSRSVARQQKETGSYYYL